MPWSEINTVGCKWWYFAKKILNRLNEQRQEK